MISDSIFLYSLTRPNKLQNHLIELSHINDMVIMQNQIVGEKLRGLNDSFIDLVFKKNSENLLCEEFEIFSKNTKELCRIFAEIEGKFINCSTENISLWTDLKEMQALKMDLQDQLSKLTSKTKEHYRYLTDELKHVNLDRDRLTLELETSEASKKSLLDEHEHLKVKLKQLSSKKSLDEKNTDERLCQKCKKVYKESENFNWSCKVHISTYSSEIWWCCGKKGESAPGCKTSKHECKEPDKEFSENEVGRTGQLFCTVRKN